MDSKTLKSFFVGLIMGLLIGVVLTGIYLGRYRIVTGNAYMKLDKWTGKTYVLDSQWTSSEEVYKWKLIID